MSDDTLNDIPSDVDLFGAYVYRVYSADDTLLYIGCASNVQSRIYMHLVASGDGRASAPVAYLYHHHTVEGPFPTKADAHAAEVAAIFNEAPLLNRQHNKKVFRLARPGGWTRIDGRTVPDSNPLAPAPFMNSLRECDRRRRSAA